MASRRGTPCGVRGGPTPRRMVSAPANTSWPAAPNMSAAGCTPGTWAVFQPSGQHRGGANGAAALSRPITSSAFAAEPGCEKERDARKAWPGTRQPRGGAGALAVGSHREVSRRWAGKTGPRILKSTRRLLSGSCSVTTGRAGSLSAKSSRWSASASAASTSRIVTDMAAGTAPGDNRQAGGTAGLDMYVVRLPSPEDLAHCEIDHIPRRASRREKD